MITPKHSREREEKLSHTRITDGHHHYTTHALFNEAKRCCLATTIGTVEFSESASGCGLAVPVKIIVEIDETRFKLRNDFSMDVQGV